MPELAAELNKLTAQLDELLKQNNIEIAEIRRKLKKLRGRK